MTTTPPTPPPAMPPTPPPLGARFDPMTGAHLGAGGAERRDSFAMQPGEPVMSFNMVTSLMPLASGAAPQTYRWALGLGVLIPVIAGALGFLAFAFVAAAVLVPAIYIVYMYDVNEWEDQPIGVVLGTVAVAAALGVGFTFLWHAGLLGDRGIDVGSGFGSIDWTTLLVLVLLVPVVSELLKQVGPLVLASRPAFDDMIDALTFGVAAGAAYAAAETIVVNRSLFSDFGSIDDPNAGFWVSLILSAAIVKPIVYGAATGIALAAWSGVGPGFRGLKPAYARGLVEAILANILFQAGLYIASKFEGTTGAVLGLVWGGLVAAALVIRLRYLLHFAVLEAALEASHSGSSLKDSARGTAYCPSCEMPLQPGAVFCVVCGTSTAAGNKVTRRRNRTEDEVGAAPTLGGAPAGLAPRDNKKTALVVGSVLATIVLAGAIGQAAAAAADSEPLPTDSPLGVTPEVGNGPVTEEPPEPADPPGPEPDATQEPSSSASSSAMDSLEGVDGSVGTAALIGDLGMTTDLRGDVRADDTGTGGATTTGAKVDIGGGVGFTVPDGWEVVEVKTDFAAVGTPGGLYQVNRLAGPTDTASLVSAHMMAIIGGGIQNLEATDIEQIPLPSSSVVSAGRLQYRGIYATQQGGTVPIDGVAFYFVTQDGTGYISDARAAQGLLAEGSELLPGFDAMLNEFISTL
jgi:hypothetical protein